MGTMNDRIHEWLDGDLPLEALAPEERAEARRIEALIERAAAAEEATSPGVADGVMMALPAGPPRRRNALFSWIDRLPFGSVSVLRPAALAAFGLAVGFGLGAWYATDGDDPGGQAEVAAPAAATIYVRFDVQVPGADIVELAGSFSDWEPRYALTPSGGDYWTVTVALEPGVHEYVFVVNGSEQVLDPAAPRIPDGFGSYNNRIALLATAT